MPIPVYVTVPELQAALKGSAGAGARTAADLPPDRLQAALDDAHAEVVGKLRTRYTIPADAETAPAQVKSLVLNIAAYIATLEWLQGRDLSERDPIVLRYQRAQLMLQQIERGTLELDLEAPAAGVSSYEAEGYNTVPGVALTEDVSAPSYGGMIPGDWQGGGLRWG